MYTEDDLDPGMNEAEDAVENHPERIPIIDTHGMERPHGYIVPGNEPVALTPLLEDHLEELLSSDGELTEYTATEGNNRENSDSVVQLSPDHDNYLRSFNYALRNFQLDPSHPDTP